MKRMSAAAAAKRTQRAEGDGELLRWRMAAAEGGEEEG